MFFHERFHGCSTQGRMQLKTMYAYIILCATVYRFNFVGVAKGPRTSGEIRPGAAFETGDFVKKKSGGGGATVKRLSFAQNPTELLRPGSTKKKTMILVKVTGNKPVIPPFPEELNRLPASLISFGSKKCDPYAGIGFFFLPPSIRLLRTERNSRNSCGACYDRGAAALHFFFFS